jgi:signal transduction histidine kinase
MTASLLKWIPNRRTVLRWGLLTVGVSLFIGTVLTQIFVGLGTSPPPWMPLLMNTYFSFIYATIMFGSLRAAASLLKDRVPIRSRKAVALHVALLSVVAVGAYALATVLCATLHPSSFGTSWELQFVTVTLAFLVTLIWSAFAYMNTFYQKLRESEAARYEARLQALRAQINPHFLFNAFNSIAALIRTRPDEAETVVEDLSDLFRYTLQASEQDTSSLRAEVEAARRYLAVEKARFRDRLSVEIDVPDALWSVSIPSMTLQPLVENAVKHGVGETQEPCTVTIAARRDTDTLLLRVTDTGPGFETPNLDAVVEDGSGLANVRERLSLFFEEDARLDLQPQGVVLRLPLDREPSFSG